MKKGKKLFIIGNGFDLSHGLKTSFKDYKEHLIKTYKIDTNCNIQEMSIHYDDSPTSLKRLPYSEMKKLAKNYFYIISNQISIDEDNDWSDFEGILGRIDFSKYLEICDGQEEYTERCRESKYNNLEDVAGESHHLFEWWLNGVLLRSTKTNEKVQELFKGDSIFLTFNYTKTLEDVYGIEPSNIKHIHGVVGEKIIYGHGVTPVESDYPYFDCDCTRLYKKNTDIIIENNKSFFIEIFSNVNEIYSYGFSYSDVDLPYIKEICKHETSHIKWFLYNHNKEENKKYENKIKESGFNGCFERFGPFN